jgi:adenosylhomocysteine nucleosidase
MPAPDILVCFAVKEEAGAFEQFRTVRPHAKILLTGMGKQNAEKAIARALNKAKPALVLTCGFAGALKPDLARGTIVFAGADSTLENSLLAAGAIAAKFHCADRVASTAAEKRALRQSTGADVVEMESQAIAEVCQKSVIPCTTVRIILDEAHEDLPLDFNQFLTADQKMSYTKLVRGLWKNPGKIGALMEFQKQCRAAARDLASTLVKIIPA